MSLAFEHIEKRIWQYLKDIPDPEIPVINIVELGVIRGLEVNRDGIKIFITPTYTGCPATNIFEKDIVHKLNQEGLKNIKIEYKYAPAWTTDWLSVETKEKLRKVGIAPPSLESKKTCPLCGSGNTVIISQFGSTACKALYNCKSCHNPFDYFKCL